MGLDLQIFKFRSGGIDFSSLSWSYTNIPSFMPQLGDVHKTLNYMVGDTIIPHIEA